MPGPSHATPIVWNDSVFVTSGDADADLLLLCLDLSDGKVRWKQTVALGDKTKGRNSMTSPSPVTDGHAVWALYGTGDLAAYDFSGKQLWYRSLAKEYGRFSIQWLYGSSPLLYQGRLYIEVLQRGDRGGAPHDSFLLCIDPQTGKNIWHHLRKTDAEAESQEAYSTPIPIDCAGRTEIVVVGGDYVTSHDALTGEEIWRGGGLRNFNHLGDARQVTTPLVADGLVIVTGAKRNPMLAFRECGTGDVTQSGLVWSYKQYPPDCVTPLFYQGKIFSLDGDRQMMVCLDPKTGAVQWQKPLGTREIFRASPTGADGKIYCLSENATAVVLSAADGQVLSTIKMDEGQAHATIAVARQRLFVRTAQNLYCIGQK